jgi:hypothetical protein
MIDGVTQPNPAISPKPIFWLRATKYARAMSSLDCEIEVRVDFPA